MKYKRAKLINLFQKFPEDLVFHLSRIKYMPDGRLEKNRCQVKVDETLCIKGIYQINSMTTNQYKLCSLITHSGSSSYGHYITYRRIGINSQQWYRISDDLVEIAGNNWEQINVQGDVCMTMYEKL